MQRASPISLILLTCLCSPAMAQNGRVSAVAPDHTACDEIADKRPVAARPAVATHTITASVAPVAALRAKPALGPAIRGGGDEGDGNVVPKPRSPKWHSFLPGMFR